MKRIQKLLCFYEHMLCIYNISCLLTLFKYTNEFCFLWPLEKVGCWVLMTCPRSSYVSLSQPGHCPYYLQYLPKYPHPHCLKALLPYTHCQYCGCEDSTNTSVLQFTSTLTCSSGVNDGSRDGKSSSSILSF